MSERVTDAGLRRLAAVPRLEGVRLDRLPKVTDAGLNALKTSRSLTGLDVADKVGVSEAALRRFVADRGPRLHRFSLVGGTVGDDFVAFLTTTAPELRTLHLIACPGVTDRSVGPLATLRKAEWVSLDRSGLTPDGVIDLRQRLGPRCTVFGPWRKE